MNFKYFKKQDVLNIPKIDFPKYNTKKFEDDINEVLRCYNSPSITTNFLKKSDDDVLKVFKEYCDSSDIKNINWEKVSEILKEQKEIVKSLKHYYKRTRPNYYIDDINSFGGKYKDSPSYPSGHTAKAYFLCELLSKEIPEIRQDLQTLSSLIGQSRIENAVHYPSDVEYGRLVGEMLGDIFVNDTSIVLSDRENNLKDLRELISSQFEDKKEAVETLTEALFGNITLSDIKINRRDCRDAAEDFLAGYPLNYITNNREIKSQLNMIASALNMDNINSVYKVNCLHNEFDKSCIESLPGFIRDYNYSFFGHQCPETYNIFDNMKDCLRIEDPVHKHMSLHSVKPYADGNGRLLRIVLLADLGFNLKDFVKILDHYNELFKSYYKNCDTKNVTFA